MNETFDKMSMQERLSLLHTLQKEYNAVKQLGLSLNMARGKPSKAQLDLSEPMLTVLAGSKDCTDGALDVRNYGELMGIPAARAYFADLLGVKSENVFVGGAASLQLMFDLLTKAWIWGLKDSPRPWCREEKVKWICPAPGYDRHFRITETLGIEMLTVPMHEDGPDMDAVEELVKDPAVKGIWCVPKYSNPEGIVFSQAVLDRFVHLRPAAPDFTVMWDNAYCVHEFTGEYVPFPSILSLAAEAGTADRFFEFASTSKITYPGAGISCMVCSEGNMAYLKKYVGAQIISYDKINQLRQVRFLKDKAHTVIFMKEHARIMGPKFGLVLNTLENELGPLGICSWRRPKGGYFVSFYAMKGTAKRIVALMKEAGVVLTDAGATYPYGRDPDDSNIRLAPSLPPLEELRTAMDVFCLCVKIAALEKLTAA